MEHLAGTAMPFIVKLPTHVRHFQLAIKVERSEYTRTLCWAQTLVPVETITDSRRHPRQNGDNLTR